MESSQNNFAAEPAMCGLAIEGTVTATTKDESIVALTKAADTLLWSHPEQASILYGKAAKLGSPNAMVRFATQVRDEDPDLAGFWLERAAILGESDAFSLYVELWSQKDQERATGLVDQILATEDPEVIFDSAWHLEGINTNVAIDMMKRAADLGSKDAPYELGLLMLRKSTKNRDQAKDFFEQAAARGNSFAVLELARMIEAQDPNRAADLYEQALKGTGDGYLQPEAAAELARLVKNSDPARALAPFERMMQSISIRAKNDYANEIDSIDPAKAAMLYADAAVVEMEDAGFAYCGIPPKRSGLPVELFASDEGNMHNNRHNPPHVLVANGEGKRGNIAKSDYFKVSISREPKVLEGENRLNDGGWASVREFISGHYDVLMDHWVHAEGQGSFNLHEKLFPEYKGYGVRRARETSRALSLLRPDESLEALIASMREEMDDERLREV